jgi:outer membrane protein assembly factor BamB
MMQLYFSGLRNVKNILVLITCFLIAACSSNKAIDVPVALKSFKPDLQVKELWSHSVGDCVDGQFLQLIPYLDGDNIYTIGAKGTLSEFNRFTGKELWEKDLDESIIAGLGGDQTHLYYANEKGELVALDKKNGHLVWKVKLTNESLAAPQSNGTLVVVQTVDGKLYAVDTATGKIKWRYNSISPILILRGSSIAYIDEDMTIAGFANGEVVALSNIDGHELWSFKVGEPKGKTELERLVDIDGKILVQGDKVYVVSYHGRLVALDKATGREYWGVPASSYTAPAKGLDQIYITSSDSSVLAYNMAAHSKVWAQNKMKYRQMTGPVVIENSLAVADYKGYIHFLSQIDGHLRARVQLDSDGIVSPLIVDGNILYVQANSGDVAAYQLKND